MPKKKKPKVVVRDLGPTAAIAVFSFHDEEVEGMPDKLLPLYATPLEEIDKKEDES